MADLAIAIKVSLDDQASSPAGRIKSALGGIGDAVTAPTRALGGLVSGLGSVGLAAAGVGAAFDAVKGVGSVFGLSALNEAEQTRASFNAFTKDAAKTEEIMAAVRLEAAKTPFAFGEMAKATASLMPVAKSSGIALTDLVHEAEVLAASNPLEGLEGASFSLREAMTGDFTSIIERFNLSRSSINKWKEEGVPNIEIVRRAMQEMGFDSDLIAAKAETLDGRWSTFQDTLVTLQMKMGQPIFDAMKEGLSTLQPLLDDNMESFEGLADSVATGLTNAISFGKTAFAELGSLVATFASGDWRGGFEQIGRIASTRLEAIGAGITSAVDDFAAAFMSWFPGVQTGWGSELADLWQQLSGWILDSAIDIIEQLGTWAAAFLDWIGPLIPPFLRELGTYLSAMAGWMVGTALPMIVSKLVEWGTAFVAWVAPRIGPLLLELGKLLLDLGGWLIGTALPAIVGKLAEWAAAFVEWVAPLIPPLLLELGKLLVDVGSWLLGTALPDLVTKLLTWGAAFVDWVAPKIVPLLAELGSLLASLGGWVITEAAPAIIDKLLTWGAAFVEWVAPKIPPLLLELGKLLVDVGSWLIDTALPDLVTKLSNWAAAFVTWLPPQIPLLLLELAKLQVSMLLWVGEQVDAIVTKLGEWGAAFIGWIAKDVLPTLPEKLGAILTAITDWVGQKVGDVVTAVSRIGEGFVKGIQDGIAGALDGFWSWLQTSFVDKIPSFVRDLLGIHSPSGVFADIGRQIVEGLRVGMESRLPSIDDLIERLVGRIADAGEVSDWLRAAINITGVDEGWLGGLSRLVDWESSGNPRAVNPESVGGQHATGLLQTLPSTFRHYALDGMGDIFNPIHNAVAAIRYIEDTYGSVYRIPGIRSGDHSEFPGYATGGIAWTPQLAHLAEREPELIVPLSRVRPGGVGGVVNNIRNVTVNAADVVLDDRSLERMLWREQVRSGGMF